jgi:putative membrane protein
MDSLRDLLIGYVLWIKALHVIAVITWMAGMLYLPRLFVYHTQTLPGTPESERFKVMERKLLRAIINPSMIAVWTLGLLLAGVTEVYDQGWMQLKFLLVIGLSAVHGMLVRGVKAFARDANTRSGTYWRVMNEVPAVLMIFIVILVVVKPF